MSVGHVWEDALALAWASFCDDTVPVGAVIVDGAGVSVSTGRNRIRSDSGPLAGTRLAHAEIDAILGLPLDPMARFDDHTIYTTTEPCLLCAGAITMTRLGAVQFAAADPVAGSAAAIPSGNPYLARRATKVVGPLDDEVAALSRLLTETWSWAAHRNGLVEQVCRTQEPAVAAVVDRVLQRGALTAVARDGGNLDEARHAIASEIDELTAVFLGGQR